MIPWSCTKEQLADWIQNYSKLRGRPKTMDALKTAFESFDGPELLTYLDRMLLKKPTPSMFEEATQRLRRRLKQKPFQLNGAAIGIAVKLLEEGSWLYFVAQWRRCAKPDAGSSITDLRFVKKLGRGAFGEVVLVQHKKTSELLAMKCGFLKDSTVKRLLGEGGDKKATEFELQQKVQSSPYTTNILSWTVLRELTMLVVVMDYCEGGDVLHRIPRDGIVDADLVWEWVKDAARALKACHAQRIMHMDVKPENLLLRRHVNGGSQDGGETSESNSKCSSLTSGLRSSARRHPRATSCASRTRRAPHRTCRPSS